MKVCLKCSASVLQRVVLCWLMMRQFLSILWTLVPAEQQVAEPSPELLRVSTVCDYSTLWCHPASLCKSFSTISTWGSHCTFCFHIISLCSLARWPTFPIVALPSWPARSWSGLLCVPAGICHMDMQWLIMHWTHLTVLSLPTLGLEFKYVSGLFLYSSWLRGFNHIQYSNCFYAWRDFQEINALFK